MGDEGQPAAGWRVVVITNIPGAIIYQALSQILPALGHKIVGVVTSPGPPRRRGVGYRDVVAAAALDADVLVSNHPSRWAAMLAPLRPDLIISGGMPWRLPRDLLELPRLGAINIHPALLPRHRGPSPFEAAIRAGDAETGITIHRMAADFDTGPILAQMRVPIDDDDDFSTLTNKFISDFPALVAQALDRVAKGDPGEAQDESLATYAPLPDETWEPVDWTQPAHAIHNQIRALTFFGQHPGGRAIIDGVPVRIAKTRVFPPESDDSGPPGSVLRRDDDQLVIQCGDGPLAILAWTPAIA